MVQAFKETVVFFHFVRDFDVILMSDNELTSMVYELTSMSWELEGKNKCS